MWQQIPDARPSSGHLFKLPDWELVNQLQDGLQPHRVREALADPQVLLHHQHGETLLLEGNLNSNSGGRKNRKTH